MTRNIPAIKQRGHAGADIFKRPSKRFSAGLMLLELLIAGAILVIIMAGIGVVIVDSQRGWINMYNKANSDVVTGGHVAKAKFDAVVRKASMESTEIDTNGKWIKAYYYQDGDSTALDRYARIYHADSKLNIEYGIVDPISANTEPTVQTICSNVTDCVFKLLGKTVQMMITLDDGTQANTIISSAVMHN